MNEAVVGIDIGSSKVCTIIGELNRSGQIKIFGVGTSECKGLKKGIVVDIDSTVEAVKDSVNQAERMSNIKVRDAYINLAGGHASLIKSSGVVAVSSENGEITSEDVERVINAARIVNIPVEREIIGVIPLQFIVDGYEHIKDPVGMIGSRLEVQVYIVTAATTTLQNLIRIVNKCDIDVNGIIIDPLAASEVLLSRDEKEMGTAIVDVGGEVTDISIYQGANLVYTKLLPVGGWHITNDISIGLKIPLSEAEKLKRQYGYASLSMLKSVEDITINGGGAGRTRVITNKELVNIIEARVQEICYFINRELETSGYKGTLPGGVVITGGGLSFLKGSLEVASSIFALPVRIGMPTFIGVASPIFSTSIGIVKYILLSKESNILNSYSGNEEFNDRTTGFKKQTFEKGTKVISKIRDFFSDFF